MLCKICSEEFDYKSGHFVKHLKNVHSLTKERYFVLTEYKNIHPKCQCGYCNDNAVFNNRTNKFYKINFEHKQYDWLEKQYIKKNGLPICKGCNKEHSKFKRGLPNKYCSNKCVERTPPTGGGWNQEKIKESVKKKYGVDNVFQLKEVKEKIKKTNNKKYNKDYYLQTDDFKEKFEKVSIEKYGVKHPMLSDSIKDLQKNSMLEKYGVEHASQIEKNRIASSARMKKNNPMFDEEIVKKSILNRSDITITTKKYKDTKLYYQSSYEYDFLEYCESLNILDKIKNGNRYKYLDKFNYLNKHFLITDFTIGDYEIEIKSNWILNLQGGDEILKAKKESVENEGKKYILILEKDYKLFNKLISYEKNRKN